MKHGLETDRTIFLVDDNLADRKIIEFAIQEVTPSARIHTFSNQHILESLESALKEEHRLPILIIVDFNLLIGLGTELISILRTRYAFSNLHIVAMSGSSDRDCMKKSYEAGANAFWEKPMHLDSMIEEMRSMLRHFSRFPLTTEQMTA